MEEKGMPDDKTMYFKMFHASEKALALILTVQQECEELFIADSSPELKVISFSPKEGETTGGE